MTDIKKGDTVRIKQVHGSTSLYGDGNEAGVEFVVTDVKVMPGIAPEQRNYYVTGDPAGRGVWINFVEKVEPARWRYNDHIVVYPKTYECGQSWQTKQLGRGVTVLIEYPLPKVYTRWENTADRLGDEITDAARAYWDAHETNPVVKEAKTRGDYVRFAYQLRYGNSSYNYTQADIDAALPVIDRLALKNSEEPS